MKKLFLAIIFCIAFLKVNAQEADPQRKNDITADPFLLIAVPMINASYERLLSHNSGLGINAMVGLGSDNTGFSQFSPYYRMYFGKKFAQGFFLEGFAPITTTTETELIFVQDQYGGYYTDGGEIRATTLGIGFGVGGKWVIRNGLVIEVNGGLGRRFGNNIGDSWSSDGLTGKIMGGLGYRF